MKLKFAALSLLLLSSISNADPLLNSLKAKPQNKLAEFLAPTSVAEWTASMPAPAGLLAVKLKNNQFMIVDTQARYAFYANSIFDIAGEREVKTEDDFNSMWQINAEGISNFKLPLMTFGVDKLTADITIMATAQNTDATKMTIKYIETFKDKYRIDVILMGSKNKAALAAASNLYCAEDRKLAKQRFMELKFPSRSDKSTHLKQLATCDTDAVLKSIQIALMYRVKTLPFSYNSHGSFYAGLPPKPSEFVDKKSMDLANVMRVKDIVDQVKGLTNEK
ncbi:hypothetical protein C0W27_16070 [Photobacterium angustum]|uniref:Uncharacterized protein n=2 Tax=Photobacterium angustum TaxID=661 RepID=A0ABX5H169_PHOAN|nr:hypothetical protein C0W27_16070 [Photobacterium angustum]